jgi:arginine utilization protein RocB
VSLAARAKELALKFTSWASVTGSSGEVEFAPLLIGCLRGFDKSWLQKIDGDSFGRSNVIALKRGRSSRTIVLTGHFDVVPISNYGALQGLAFDPLSLLPPTIARLKETGENPKALADFESGDFLPGRGLLDMKAGLAAGLAAIEAYQGEASLLFIAVADEEERSAGARAAVSHLRDTAQAESLDIKLVVNLDAISDQGDGNAARVVTTGSIGKQLLSAFVVGKETHAGYPQDGVNAAYIAAELVIAFELAPELAETIGTEVAAPPTALSAKDLKQGYNVTTPGLAFVYWNTLQHRRSGTEVLGIAKSLCAVAISKVETRTGRKIRLMDFAELAELVPDDEMASIKNVVAAQPHLDLPEQSKRVTQMVWERSGLSGPAVVMGFGSIPYPAVSLTDEKLKSLICNALDVHGIGQLEYFAGISDMSFFGEASGNLDVVAANTPIWGTSFAMPKPAGYPTINLGPWGRDYHHWLERLHAPYAFEVLPKALLSVIEAAFKAG